ncbi:MAG: ATPase [Sphingomonadales bacterium]|nr:ATPase [Sphingomonadales bacterium]
MPQIAQLSATYASQIFWALLFFGIVFFVIGKGMVPKVMATVDARDRQIAGDLKAAEAAREAANAQEEAWKVQSANQRAEAQAVIAKAKADAARATEARLAEANGRIDARVAEADARIGAARAGALGEIEAVAAEAASEIVSRLAGVTVDAGAAASAVKEALHG